MTNLGLQCSPMTMSTAHTSSLWSTTISQTESLVWSPSIGIKGTFLFLRYFCLLTAVAGAPFRYKDIAVRSYNHTLTKRARPDDPRPPSSSFKSYTGKYLNPGYGPIELCLVNQDEEDSCGTSVLPGTLKDVPTLIAKWNKFWSTHLKLEHFDGDVWNMTVLASRVRPPLLSNPERN
jgi:hypothetical protein